MNVPIGSGRGVANRPEVSQVEPRDGVRPAHDVIRPAVFPIPADPLISVALIRPLDPHAVRSRSVTLAASWPGLGIRSLHCTCTPSRQCLGYSVFRLRSSVFGLPSSDFRLPTSDFLGLPRFGGHFEAEGL